MRHQSKPLLSEQEEKACPGRFLTYILLPEPGSPVEGPWGLEDVAAAESQERSVPVKRSKRGRLAKPEHPAFARKLVADVESRVAPTLWAELRPAIFRAGDADT